MDAASELGGEECGHLRPSLRAFRSSARRHIRNLQSYFLHISGPRRSRSGYPRALGTDSHDHKPLFRSLTGTPSLPAPAMPAPSLHPLPVNPTTGQQPLASLGSSRSGALPPSASAGGSSGVSRETLKSLQDVYWSDDEVSVDRSGAWPQRGRRCRFSSGRAECLGGGVKPGPGARDAQRCL